MLRFYRRAVAAVAAITLLLTLAPLPVRVYASEPAVLYSQDYDLTPGDVTSGTDGMTFTHNQAWGTYVRIADGQLEMGRTIAVNQTSFEVSKDISEHIGERKDYTVRFKLKAHYTSSATNFFLGSCFAFEYIGTSTPPYRFQYHPGSGNWVTNLNKYYSLTDWTEIKIVVRNLESADVYVGGELAHAGIPQRGSNPFSVLKFVFNSTQTNGISIDDFIIEEEEGETPVDPNEPQAITEATVPVAGDPAVDADKFDVFLALGQSNMSGRAPIEEGDRYTIPGAYLLNGNDQWEAGQVQYSGGKWLGFNRYSSVRDPGKYNGLSPADTFARAAAPVLRPQGRAVGVVGNSRGDTSIEKWQKGYTGTDDADLYEEAVRRALIAKGKGTLRAILWHQGGADVNTAPATYFSRFETFVQNFREDVGVPDLPIIIGELGGFSDTEEKAEARRNFNKNIIAALPGRVSSCYAVTSVGTSDIGDSLHFDSQGIRIIGKAYADAVFAHVYGDAPVEKKAVAITATESSAGSLRTAVAADGEASVYDWANEATYWQAPVGSYWQASFDGPQALSGLKSYFVNPWNYVYQYKIYLHQDNEWNLAVDKSAVYRYTDATPDGSVLDDLEGAVADGIRIEVTGVRTHKGEAAAVDAKSHEFIVLGTQNADPTLYGEDFEQRVPLTKLTALGELWTATGNTGESAYEVREEENGNRYAYISTRESGEPATQIRASLDFSTLVPTGPLSIDFDYSPHWGTGQTIGFAPEIDGTLRFESGPKSLAYHDGTEWKSNLFPMEYGQWYRMRITVDQEQEQWKLSVNGRQVRDYTPFRSDKDFVQKISFIQYNNLGGAMVDRISIYPGEPARPDVIEALRYDYNSFTGTAASMGAGAKQFTHGLTNTGAANIHVEAVGGKFGKAANDTALLLRNTTTAVLSGASVDAYAYINDTAEPQMRVQPGESFALSVGFAFDDKLTAPFYVNGRAHTYRNNALTTAKVGDSTTTNGYFIRIYPDRVNILGTTAYYFDSACVAEKWYNIKVVVTAGSLDNTTPTTFSAYLDDALLCEDVPVTAKLRFDPSPYTFANAPVLGLQQIWLNYHVGHAKGTPPIVDGQRSYPAGGVYFDNVTVHKYTGGARYEHNPVAVRHADLSQDKLRAGMVSYVSPAATVAQIRDGLTANGAYKLTMRDASGAEAIATAAAGGKYYEAVSPKGTRLYGKLVSDSQTILENSGTDEAGWLNFNRSTRDVFPGLGGKPAGNTAFGMQGPFSNTGQTNYNDFLYHELKSDTLTELNWPLTVDASVYLSGEINTTAIIRGNQAGSSTMVERVFAWFEDGKVYVPNATGGRMLAARYTPNQWVRISVTFQIGSSLATIRINGETVIANASFGNIKYAKFYQLRFGANVTGPMDTDTFVALDDIKVTAGYYSAPAVGSVRAVEGSGAVVDSMDNRIIFPAETDPAIESLLDYLEISGYNAGLFTDDTLQTQAGSLDGRPVLVCNDGTVYRYYTLYLGEPRENGIYHTVSGGGIQVTAELYGISQAVLAVAEYTADDRLNALRLFDSIESGRISAGCALDPDTDYVRLLCWEDIANLRPLLDAVRVSLD